MEQGGRAVGQGNERLFLTGPKHDKRPDKRRDKRRDKCSGKNNLGPDKEFEFPEKESAFVDKH